MQKVQIIIIKSTYCLIYVSVCAQCRAQSKDELYLGSKMKWRSFCKLTALRVGSFLGLIELYMGKHMSLRKDHAYKKGPCQ